MSDLATMLHGTLEDLNELLGRYEGMLKPHEVSAILFNVVNRMHFMHQEMGIIRAYIHNRSQGFNP